MLSTPFRTAQSTSTHSVGFFESPALVEPWSVPFDAGSDGCLLCSRLTKACKDPLSALKAPKKNWPVCVVGRCSQCINLNAQSLPQESRKRVQLFWYRLGCAYAAGYYLGFVWSGLCGSEIRDGKLWRAHLFSTYLIHAQVVADAVLPTFSILAWSPH